jgi:hypothetical protein
MSVMTPDDAPLTTIPLKCFYCGKLMTVSYVPQSGKSASCQCPHDGCRKIAVIAGMARIVSVRPRSN